MYFIDLSIPYEITVFLLKEEVFNKSFNNDSSYAFKTALLDKQKATKLKVDRVLNDVINMNTFDNSIKREDIYTKNIKNVDLKLYILPEQEKVYFCGEYCVFLGITIPGINVPYNIITPIQVSSFVDIVSQSQYITNGNLHGKFLYRISQEYYQYKPEDSNLLENLKRINLLGENRKTTSFKPGHVYLLKDKSKILYLGKLKESRDSSYYSSGNNYKYPFFNNTDITRIKYKYCCCDLYINLDDIDRISYYMDNCFSEFFKLQKGSNISEFIQKWVEFFENLKADMSSCLSCGVNLTGGGVDLGELLVDDNQDLTSILSNICISRLDNAITKKDEATVTIYSLGISADHIKSLPDSTKDKISNILIKPKLDKMFKSVIYRMNDDMINKTKNENSSGKNIFQYMKGISTYYIDILNNIYNIKNSFSSVIYSGRDKELDSLIIESKKANFKK